MPIRNLMMIRIKLFVFFVFFYLLTSKEVIIEEGRDCRIKLRLKKENNKWISGKRMYFKAKINKGIVNILILKTIEHLLTTTPSALFFFVCVCVWVRGVAAGGVLTNLLNQNNSPIVKLQQEQILWHPAFISFSKYK